MVGQTINGTEDKVITASMTLSRQLMSVFMVTYLPTILMNIINQTINYICCENKDPKKASKLLPYLSEFLVLGLLHKIYELVRGYLDGGTPCMRNLMGISDKIVSTRRNVNTVKL